MPREVFGSEFHFLARDEILTFEEIFRVARVVTTLGVNKIRLTGGEPLLRRDLVDLVGMLASLPDIDLALTTNGVLLPELAADLVEAGLQRVTVSFDALDPAIFREMSDTEIGPELVLRGIEAASAAGLDPIKINAVIKRNVNLSEVVRLAEFFKEAGHTIRFIEYMDVGETNGWRMEEVVPVEEIVRAIHRAMPIERLPPAYPGEVAQRWRYLDGSGEVGVVASVTQPFCGSCTRARLSSEGKLYTCLFASHGQDLRERIRSNSSDEDLASFIAQVWLGRSDRYSELRSAATTDSSNAAPSAGSDNPDESGESPRIEMSYIGG
jgi:cyclic pyranopterin phosphate synthase